MRWPFFPFLLRLGGAALATGQAGAAPLAAAQAASIGAQVSGASRSQLAISNVEPEVEGDAEGEENVVMVARTSFTFSFSLGSDPNKVKMSL